MFQGGLPLVRNGFGGDCREKMASGAMVFALVLVLFATITPGNLEIRSMTTRRCLPSGVGS